ncbi:hypothetical protein T478_1399 [Candidatus Nitrosopelagicus brevis]|uniref:Uncharacterized protein n=1 Tax=Candidatus Nitrosopelagicus brevis TaxID=1410606 RepID=A0A0A7V2J6_9ARCH|nr:hypothetical protein T478_1399 [Candidatus Nitrosopelagicus brevis]
MISLNPLEYCNNCFHETEPDIVQTRTDQFLILTRLDYKKYKDIQEFVELNSGKMNSEFRLAGFRVPLEIVDQTIDFLRKIDVTVHDLLTHVRNVFSGYTKETLSLGRHRFVKLPKGREHRFLDPKTRRWIYIKNPENSIGVPLREHQIIKCENQGNDEYYYLGAEEELHLVDKRAAFNLASRTFTNRTVYWADHKMLGFGTIKLNSLGMIPDDIFNSLTRLRPNEVILYGMLYFKITYFELLKVFLKANKINLLKCEDFVTLPGDNGKASGSPLISLSDIESEKIQTISNLIEKLNGKITKTKTELKVTFENDSYSILFVDNDSSRAIPVHEENKLYIPIALIENIREFEASAHKILYRAGKKLDIKKTLAECVEISNDADLSFVTECLTENIDDIDFIKKLLSDPSKESYLRNWFEDLVKNTTLEGWINAPEGLFRKLSHIFSKEVVKNV